MSLFPNDFFIFTFFILQIHFRQLEGR